MKEKELFQKNCLAQEAIADFSIAGLTRYKISPPSGIGVGLALHD